MTQPVTKWENEAVKGMACTTNWVHREFMQQVDALRKREADYLDSLPVEPTEAILAALRTMHPDGDGYPEGFGEAMHLAHALRPMIESLETDESGRERDALLYIADRIAFGLEKAARQLDHISETLGNPGRIEREAKRG